MDDDSLEGGAGKDQFFGEGGPDNFISADGVAETVDCGIGPGETRSRRATPSSTAN